MGHSKSKVQKVWNKASKVRGKGPNRYRKDSCGKLIFRYSYGKQSDMAWEIDHIKSRKNGGGNNIENLQALHWRNNRRKGSSNRNRC